MGMYLKLRGLLFVCQKTGFARGVLAMGISVLVFSACSTSRVSFDSTPTGANIYAKSLNEGKERLIGKTPLELSASELSPSGAGPVSVEYRLDGYQTYKILVTELSAVDLVLRAKLEASSGLEDPYVVSKLIDDLFSAQQDIRDKNYTAALSKLESLKKTTPQLSAVYELEGGVHMLQSNSKLALDAYRTAITLNPDSVFSRLMIKKIERYVAKTNQNDRAPASSR